MTKQQREKNNSAQPQPASTPEAVAPATKPAEAETAASGPVSVAAAKQAMGQLRRFARQHPGAALLAAAGASAVLGAEIAVGAVVGVGAALLVAKKSGREARSDLEKWGREALTTGTRWAGKLQRKRTASPVGESKAEPTAPGARAS